MKENEPKTIECWSCNTAFEWTRSEPYQLEPRHCASCAAEVIEVNMRQAREALEAKIHEMTPARFQTTNTSHPDFNFKLWQRVKQWMPTPEWPWLGMIGPTGTSKTRCAFLLLPELAARMIVPPKNPDHGIRRPSIAVVSAYRFAEAVAGQFTDEKAEAVEFLSRIRRAEILLIDDLGKQRNTPSIASELFALIDYRHAKNLVTIWTANTSPEGIVAGISEDTAGPLAGRIRECSSIINLG